MPNLRVAPTLLPTCATLVAWNVAAGLKASDSPPPVPPTFPTLASSGGEEGGSAGGGLERKVYGLEAVGASSLLFVVVGFVVEGVVRSLKFDIWAVFADGIVAGCCWYVDDREENKFEMSLRGLETWRGMEAGGFGGACVSGTLDVRVNSSDCGAVLAAFGLPKKDMMLAVPSAALFFLTGAFRASMSRSLASSWAEFISCMREAADMIFGGILIDAVEKPAGFCIVTLEAGMNPATGTIGPLCCSLSVLRRLFA